MNREEDFVYWASAIAAISFYSFLVFWIFMGVFWISEQIGSENVCIFLSLFLFSRGLILASKIHEKN